MTNRLEELKHLFFTRPVGQYRRQLNIDRGGGLVKSGCMVRFAFPGLPEQTVKLEYLPRLGWCYYSNRHSQYFMMPTEYFPPTRVNVFHYCEVES